MKKNKAFILVELLAAAAFIATLPVAAQPAPTLQIMPAIVHGPLLLDVSETSVTVVWGTDVPCQPEVLFGENELNQSAEPQQDGLIPVGTHHAVRLTGLLPGRTYRYRLVSVAVGKIRAYWPITGLTNQSPEYTFSTFDRKKPAISFDIITDTHEDVGRIQRLLKLVDWTNTDFLVHTGDAFNSVESDAQIYAKWLDPITAGLGPGKTMLFARGNHDTRGSLARELSSYVPAPEGRFYFTRDDGPIHFIIIDTTEDKADNSVVFSGLNNFAPYRKEEYDWFEQEMHQTKTNEAAPFRVVLMHQPTWGWVDGENQRWDALANEGRVDLVIAGHIHRYSHRLPVAGRNFPILVVGQDQLARVEATAQELKVTVCWTNGLPVDSFVVPAKPTGATAPGAH